MACPTPQCLKRLQIELKKMHKEPDASYQLNADPQNMLHCYFVVNGPEGTPYAGGRYVGLLEIPPDYPFKPPAVQMCTPSGRFVTGQHICLSNSSYHPESWSPMWGLRTILVALVSFFVSEERTLGSINASEAERRKYAADSRRYNVDRLKAVYMRVLHDAYLEDLAFLEKEEEKKKPQSAAKQPRRDPSDDGDDHHNGASGGGGGGGGAAKNGKTGNTGSTTTTTTAASGNANGKPTTARKQNANPCATAAAVEAEEAKGEKEEYAAADAEDGATDSDAASTEDDALLATPSSEEHARSDPRHGGALMEKQKVPLMFLFDGMPWRRWASLVVLVVVGFALADLMR